jgi:hypothetical protein
MHGLIFLSVLAHQRHTWNLRYRQLSKGIAALLLLLSISVPLPAASLSITNAAVRASEDGPPGDNVFVSGETVYFSFQVTGFGNPMAKTVRLSYHVEALDPKGVKIDEPVDSILDANLSEQDKEWQPKLRAPFVIPSLVLPGTYKIIVRVTDDISHASAQAEIPFRISGHNVEPSPELTLRNFGFYRGEGEQNPLPAAVYSPGDTVFARFDITGYQYGKNNAVEVSYGVAILNPAGKQIYAEPNAATEKSESFYPKPFVPGAMNLNLQAGISRGDYTLVVTVVDRIASQSFESRQMFRIE